MYSVWESYSVGCGVRRYSMLVVQKLLNRRCKRADTCIAYQYVVFLRSCLVVSGFVIQDQRPDQQGLMT